MGKVRRPVIITLSPVTIEELRKQKVLRQIPISRQLENAFWERRVRRRV